MKNITIQKPTSLQIFNNVAKRLIEMEVTPEDALDELVYLDPETELGRAMTKVMIDVTALKLLDYYKGFSRDSNEIRVHLSAEAPVESLKKLVSQIEQSIETVPVGTDDSTPLIKAEMFRSNMNKKDFDWIVKLNVFLEEPDEYSDIPVEIKMNGEIDVNGKEPPVGEEEL